MSTDPVVYDPFVPPTSIEEARQRVARLEDALVELDAQLAMPLRLDSTGQPLPGEEQLAWRRRAIGAARHYERKRKDLNRWINGEQERIARTQAAERRAVRKERQAERFQARVQSVQDRKDARVAATQPAAPLVFAARAYFQALDAGDTATAAQAETELRRLLRLDGGAA